MRNRMLTLQYKWYTWLVDPVYMDNINMPILIIIIIITMLMPVQQNRFTHIRVLLVLTARGILAQF
jgi:hypothetical protein